MTIQLNGISIHKSYKVKSHQLKIGVWWKDNYPPAYASKISTRGTNTGNILISFSTKYYQKSYVLPPWRALKSTSQSTGSSLRWERLNLDKHCVKIRKLGTAKLREKWAIGPEDVTHWAGSGFFLLDDSLWRKPAATSFLEAHVVKRSPQGTKASVQSSLWMTVALASISTTTLERSWIRTTQINPDFLTLRNNVR